MYKKYTRSRERNLNYRQSSPYKRVRKKGRTINTMKKIIPIGVFLDEINI